MKSETNFKLHNLRPFEEEIPSCKKEVKSEKKKKEKQIQINKNWYKQHNTSKWYEINST